MSDVVDRFMRYCSVASQSDPLTSATVPSKPQQFEIARVVADDLRELGALDVVVDEHAYVTAHWPASSGMSSFPAWDFVRISTRPGKRMAILSIPILCTMRAVRWS